MKYHAIAFVLILVVFYLLLLLNVVSHALTVGIGLVLTLFGFIFMITLKVSDSYANNGAFLFITGLALIFLLYGV